MLKKLRIKFIAIIMAMVTVVVVASFTTICIVEQQRVTSTVNSTLEQTLEQAGGWIIKQQESIALNPSNNVDQNNINNDIDPSLLNNNGTDKQPNDPAATSSLDSIIANNQAGSSKSNGLRIGGPNQNSDQPIAVYALNENGMLLSIEYSTTASISDDVIEQVASAILSANEGFGDIEGAGLHYLKRTISGVSLVAFADSSSMDSWKSLAYTLAIVGALTIVVFFLLSLLFSKWALKPVEEAWETQKQFVTDASHELKTPLTVILANNAILQAHPDRSIASESKWLESTQTEAERMEGLIGEMLSLAQIEARADIPLEPVDLSDLVAGITLQFESVAFEHNFGLETYISDGIIVQGNNERLHKLISTLIENASKYVNEGGSVSVTLSRENKNACLRVNNTGSYIQPDDLKRIFDRFYRTDKARTSDTGGFGLGLAIAREIARSHKGDIVAESSKEVGTTFIATIPLA